MSEFKIATDTASLAFYDVDALKHRLNDDADWWDLEEDLIKEINLGNMGFCDLSTDGMYDIKINASGSSIFDLNFNLTLPSGRLFVGPGEEITGASFDPDNSKNNCGKILSFPKGFINISVKKTRNVINIFIIPSTKGGNAFEEDFDFEFPE